MTNAPQCGVYVVECNIVNVWLVFLLHSVFTACASAEIEIHCAYVTVLFGLFVHMYLLCWEELKLFLRKAYTKHVLFMQSKICLFLVTEISPDGLLALN